MGVFELRMQLYFRFSVQNTAQALFFLVTVFTSFHKLRVEGAGSCWEYFVVGPLFLASKGQEWCHFSVWGVTLLETESLTDDSVTSEMITPLWPVI